MQNIQGDNEYDVCECGHTRDEHVSYCPEYIHKDGITTQCECSVFTKKVEVSSGYPFNPETGEDWPECHQEISPNQ